MKYKITAAYFSPTGGTKRALEDLCSFWNGETTYVALNGAEERADVHLGSTDLLVLALPVYASTIPDVPGLLDGLHGDNTPCVVVATYGNCKYDHALAQMKELLSHRGFRCVAGAAVITPHVFAPTLGTGRPDAEDMDVLKAFAAQVEAKLDQPEWQEAELPGNPTPTMHHIKPLVKDRDWDICLGCGLCAKVCPTGAMSMQTLMWDDTKCISCMSCVSCCPVGALGFNCADIASRLTARFTERQPIETFI